MSKHQKIQASAQKANHTADLLLWFAAVIVLAGSVGAFYWYQDLLLVLRVLMVMVGAAIAVFVAYKTQRGQAIARFLVKTRRELALVVWPSRQETIQMTLVVFVASFVTGLFLWLVDSLFMWIVGLLTGQGS